MYTGKDEEASNEATSQPWWVGGEGFDGRFDAPVGPNEGVASVLVVVANQLLTGSRELHVRIGRPW